MPLEPSASGPLFLLRIAGLPTAVMEPFASPLCRDLLQRLAAGEAALSAARERLAEEIFPLVHGAAPDVRRFLLAVKRDAYNGRTIAKYARQPEWEAHLGAARATAEELRQLEAAGEDDLAAFAAAFEAERAREHAALLPHLEDRRLLRAIALGSPLVAEQLRGLPRASGGLGRKEKRLESSLLRYLSRAAFKLSPFSSFTPVALALAGRGRESPLSWAEWLAAETVEKPLLRVQPAFLDQLGALLLAHRPFQLGLAAEINPSLGEIEPGIARWYRPGHWYFDTERQAMRYTPDAFLKSPLKDPLLALLTGEPGAAYPSLRALEERVAAHFPQLEADQVAARIEKLRRLGVLLLRLPWPSNSPHLEQAMSRCLAEQADRRLQELGALLGSLAAAEESLAEAAEPVPALAALDGRVDAIWELGRDLAPGAPDAPYVRIKDGQFFDDVLRTAAGAPEGAPLLAVAAARLESLLDQAAPLVDLASLADARFDFLVQLGDLLAEAYPAGGEIGLFEAFDRAKPLFSAFGIFEKGSGEKGERLFDPRGAAAAAELAELRRAANAAAATAAISEDGVTRLDPVLLAQAAALVPAAYRCPVGPCLFVQPADPAGSRYVVNRIYEGTGRYSSRFGPLLGAAAYERFAAQFRAAAGDGSAERPFLLDLIHAQGDTLNVHLPLTARLLAHPGDHVAAAPAALVALADLRVRLGGPGELPSLADREGKRYLPVQLGGAARRFLPTLFRFLSYFGPSEILPRLPPAAVRPLGDGKVRDRLVLGDLILLRRRFAFTREALPAELFGASESEAYRAVDGWRRRHGMPEKVFLIENVYHPTRSDLYKPQYLDLTSPLFVALLRAALKTHEGAISFEEMLPEPDAAVADRRGNRYFAELLVERPSATRRPFPESPA